jgi:hypothetical protein
MINNSELGLPIGRDPLVMASLLDPLWERQPLDSTFIFREGDILEKLEWPRNTESRTLIKRALERYVLTAYCLIDQAITEEDNRGRSYLSIGRLLVGYENTVTLLPQKRTNQPESTRVQFLPGLIHDVISERKYFMGIEFQKLHKIQRIFG